MKAEWSFRYSHDASRWCQSGKAKATSPGWPDPSTWIAQLHERLTIRAANYEAETDILFRRNKAAGMLGEVMHALQILPPFGAGSAHLPIKDLLIFFADLDLGRSHPWAKPVNFGGTNATTTAQRELRQWAVAVVHVLWMAGHSLSEAYRVTARAMTDSKRSGKSGNPISWRSVQQWYRGTERPLDTVVGARLAQWWQTAPCAHDELVTNCRTGPWNTRICIDSKQVAEALARVVFALPNLRDRFHPTLSD